ncbi:MAG: bacterial Ig-like domain-containing protein, partial [Oscillospiraceae bacterium]|nr:bacterial Ig-like domain-containing protein [Oscillospiraceae bacterium]
MKKKWILSGLLALCLCLAWIPCAYADEYIALGSYTAGSELDCPIANVIGEEELTVENLPDGLRVEVRESELGRALYLAGQPLVAGSFTFTVSGEQTLVCAIDIAAATPTVSVSEGVSCWTGDSAALSVAAWTADAGTLSYQWYLENGMDSRMLPGENSSTLRPDTSQPGTWNYVCEVTNNNNGDQRVAMSDIITLTVREVQVSSVSIETMPNKMDYAVGENFDHTGMSLRVTYDNGTQEVITSGYEIEVDPFDLAGTHTVKVSYGGRGWSFYVNVQKKEAVVSGIGVLTLPNKREYLLGESLQTAGLSIRVYTDDGEHYDVSTELDCSPTVLNTEGEEIITVKYQEKTCTFKVTVKNDKVVTGISVLTLPTTRSYTVGDYLDTSGLSVQLNSNKGSEVLTGGYTVSPKVLASPGTQEVTVRYDKYTAKFTVTVKAKEAVTPTPRPTAVP